MAPRSVRRSTSSPAPCGRRVKSASPAQPGGIAKPDRDEIAERAARLGVTTERVLQDYARIAFADLRRVAD